MHEHALPGRWPRPDADALTALARELAWVPDGATVLLDGLLASGAEQVVATQARRLRLVVLLHLPLGATACDPLVRDSERRLLSACAAVIATSGWTRSWLIEEYSLPAHRVRVAEPGVDTAALAPGSEAGDRLLCVAALTPGKGHDVLVAALARVRDLGWRCVCVGSLECDPGHVERLRHQAREVGIGERISFVGPCTGRELDAAYAAAGVLVLATRFESYAMVVTEALARGLPVVATSVGALPGTLGRLPDGTRPGLLVPPDDPAALAAALRRWLGDDGLRVSLRDAARRPRTTLAGWDRTIRAVSRVLALVAV